MSKAILLLIMCAGSVHASDSITFKSGMRFDHQGHKREVGMCSYCHDGTPGKIVAFGKEWAHRVCIDCHIDFKEGPQSCTGCHQSDQKKD
jgi:hypothetical protein